MKNLFAFLEIKVTIPQLFGWFHFGTIIVVTLATVLLCLKHKDCSDKTLRAITFFSWLAMFVLEIYKQIVYTFNYTDAGVISDYQWYIFPFQLCATPLFAMPFIAFMKDGKIREFFVSYCSTFTLFGGLAVIAFPSDMFVSILGINFQGMLHHGAQVALGIFYLVHERKKLNFKYFLKSVPVFAGLLIIACILNETVYSVFIQKGINETFNMFYISRHFPCTLPLLSAIYPLVPYPVFLMIYILGFILISLAVYYIAVGFIMLSKKTLRHKSL